MRTILTVLLVSLSLTTQAQFLQPNQPPLNVTLAWDQSADPSVVGYKIYQGVESRGYTNVVTVPSVSTTTVTITNLPRGITNYFAATSYNAVGLESTFSKEVSHYGNPFPAPPGGLRTTNVTLKVAVENAPSPQGPWALLASLGTTVSSPGYFRSMVEIQRPTLETPKVRVLVSPKQSAAR